MVDSIARRRRPAPGTVIAAMAMVAALGSGAYAAIPDPDGTIHACYQKNNGQLRAVDSRGECRTSEAAIDWNKEGRAGPSGPPGPKGDPGPAGPAGPAGAPQAFAAGGGAIDSVNIPAGEPGADVLSKYLPAGKYVLSASIDVANTASGTAYVTCAITGAGDAATATASVEPFRRESLSIDGTVDFAGGTIAVHCVGAPHPSRVQA